MKEKNSWQIKSARMWKSRLLLLPPDIGIWYSHGELTKAESIYIYVGESRSLYLGHSFEAGRLTQALMAMVILQMQNICCTHLYIEAMQITLSLYRWPIATTPSSQHCARDGWGAREVPRRLSWLPSRWLKVASLYGQRLSQVFYALVFLVGVVGNTLVIYVVVRFSKMHTVNQHRHSRATFMHYYIYALCIMNYMHCR